MKCILYRVFFVPMLALALVMTNCQSERGLECNEVPDVVLGSNELSSESTIGVGETVAVTFDSTTKEWLAAFTSGNVVQISASGKTSRKFTVSALDPRLTRLSADGNTLLTITAGLLKAWDLDNGSILRDSKHPGLLGVWDINVSDDAQWAVLAAYGYDVTPIRGRTGSFGKSGSHVDYTTNELAVAINRSNTMIAYGEEWVRRDNKERIGRVGLLSLGEEGLADMYRFKVGPLTFPLEEFSERIPIRLAFDSNDSWLAVLNERSIDLYELGSLAHRNSQALALSDYGAITFNSTATQLAVGYSGGLKVNTVPELKQILDKPEAQVTSAAFSPDGCLLAWGDVKGTVHIINAPKP